MRKSKEIPKGYRQCSRNGYSGRVEREVCEAQGIYQGMMQSLSGVLSVLYKAHIFP